VIFLPCANSVGKAYNLSFVDNKKTSDINGGIFGDFESSRYEKRLNINVKKTKLIKLVTIFG